MSTTVRSDQLFEVREFNRFYTAELGLLNRRYLNGEFSLTEARALYEIHLNRSLTAVGLRQKLHLDKGYVSRLLKGLTDRGLVVQTTSSGDAREKLLELTKAGKTELRKLNCQSDEQINHLLRPLGAADRTAIADGFRRIRTLLGRADAKRLKIVHLTAITDDAFALLNEYFDTIGVVQRDTRKAIGRAIVSKDSEMWIASHQELPVGCVVLKKLKGLSGAAECKRLFVRPGARGRGVGEALMEELETYARKAGFKWVYLDSKDDLTAALMLYRRRGYVACGRYNDNPQATIFMRKRLGSRSVSAKRNKFGPIPATASMEEK